jgi:hypothetical protein
MLTVILIKASQRLAYYIIFRLLPFQTQTDEEDKAQYFVEGRDFSRSQTSSTTDNEKMMEAGIMVTTTPVVNDK